MPVVMVMTVSRLRGAKCCRLALFQGTHHSHSPSFGTSLYQLCYKKEPHQRAQGCRHPSDGLDKRCILSPLMENNPLACLRTLLKHINSTLSSTSLFLPLPSARATQASLLCLELAIISSRFLRAISASVHSLEFLLGVKYHVQESTLRSVNSCSPRFTFWLY